MDTSLFLLLLFVLLVVLSVFIIPLIIRLIKMTRSIESMASELNDTVKKLNNVVGTVEDSVDHVKSMTEPVGELGKELTKVWSALKETEGYVSNIKGQVHAFSYALKVTFDTLLNGLFRKKDNRSEEGNKKEKES